jgi:hypothetical protein
MAKIIRGRFGFEMGLNALAIPDDNVCDAIPLKAWRATPNGRERARLEIHENSHLSATIDHL